MPQGIVSNWNCGGFCFISPILNGVKSDDRSQSIFCHVKAFQRAGIDSDNVKVGDLIEFTIVPSKVNADRVEAADIKLIS